MRARSSFCRRPASRFSSTLFSRARTAAAAEAAISFRRRSISACTSASSIASMRSCHTLNSVSSRSSVSYLRMAAASCSCFFLYTASSRRMAAVLSFTSAVGALGAFLGFIRCSNAAFSAASRSSCSARTRSMLVGRSSVRRRMRSLGSEYFSSTAFLFCSRAASMARSSLVGPSFTGGGGLPVMRGGGGSSIGIGFGRGSLRLNGTCMVFLPASCTSNTSLLFSAVRYTFFSSSTISASKSVSIHVSAVAIRSSTNCLSYSLIHSSRE
mmetsp:Transcript_3925/g.9812  ORF Transcript_3925/g.9812 Transcript_3925/m.9812 type:complete len:269 (-) Transcript_3925:251-1057(-)